MLTKLNGWPVKPILIALPLSITHLTVTSMYEVSGRKIIYRLVNFGSGICTRTVLALMLELKSARTLMITSAYENTTDNHNVSNNTWRFGKSKGDHNHPKGSCFFKQCINTEGRLKWLSHAIIHDWKFPIWWHLAKKGTVLSQGTKNITCFCITIYIR